VKVKTAGARMSRWLFVCSSRTGSLSRRLGSTGESGTEDYRATVVSFFTAWACGALGPWVIWNSTGSPSLSDLKPVVSAIAE